MQTTRLIIISRNIIFTASVPGSNFYKKLVLIQNDRSKSTYPKIYTKTGDKGTTVTFAGDRREKDSPIFHALGTIDELVSHIGMAIEHGKEKNGLYIDQLIRIQCVLQDIASLVATPLPVARESHLKRVAVPSGYVEELETWIDEYTAQLPPLTNFILPGGGKTSASLHIARTVCRRAERCVVPLVRNGEVESEPMKYLNRLSDFLFTAARYAAKLDNQEETIYIKPKLSS
ncbi:corrinoid adenosyltransferase MMAB-like isoform X2 [Artemia franciscana]|uniref:Corrinoid adenosyltransferase MMAB n=1 Tax=Artemia franciscana TaxID=6661 RepID=A0AA88HLQ9_ARTSF|nr:hypothetical protein QYM36_015480 [Artemia franciscana]